MNEKDREELLKNLRKLFQEENEQEFRSIDFEGILSIVQLMGMTKQDCIEVFQDYILLHPPRFEHERILQLQRLIQITGLADKKDPEDIEYIKNIGIRLGIHPLATEEILRVMDDYPHRNIPSERLKMIFRTHHN